MPMTDPEGVVGVKLCADVPQIGSFQWGLTLLAEGLVIPGANSPRMHWGNWPGFDACRVDLDALGAVSLSAVSRVLALLGRPTVCTVPDS